MNQQSASFKYKAFISYNEKDSRVANLIAKYLLKNGIDVWLDSWSVYPGDSLTDSIANGITQANAFLLLASVNSMGSDWVREELRVALNRRIANPDFRILTVRVDNCTLHPLLQDYLWVQLKTPRHLRQAMSRILAAILQIDLKPALKGFKSRFYLNRLGYTIHFKERRGASASVSEMYDLAILEDMKSIKKHIYHSGSLAKKEFVAGTAGLSGKIELLEKTTAMERLKISFDSTLRKGTNWQFAFNHEIRDNFFNDEEFVYYTIETPTKGIDFSLEFDTDCRVTNLRVYKRMGQEEVMIKSTKSNRKMKYTHILPDLYDTFVFRWAWAI